MRSKKSEDKSASLYVLLNQVELCSDDDSDLFDEDVCLDEVINLIEMNPLGGHFEYEELQEEEEEMLEKGSFLLFEKEFQIQFEEELLGCFCDYVPSSSYSTLDSS
jgi:hypothetical protein